jgi:preprotein translocase subunit SecA
MVETARASARGNAALDRNELLSWLTRTFPIGFKSADLANADGDPEALVRRLVDRVDEAYRIKEKTETEESIRWLERQIMLTAIDRLYQEHLYAMDALRQGVMLRAYGQRDPLVEYKQEAYGMFSDLMEDIKDQILSTMFRSATNVAAFQQLLAGTPQEEHHDVLGQFAGVLPEGGGEAPQQQGGGHVMRPQMPAGVTVRRRMPKVGRNDPCPCGSGKKYKQCCGS